MKKLLLAVLFSLPFTASAEGYFECHSTSDPLTAKVCATPSTVEMARRFNASFQRVFAQAKTYNDIKPAVKIKNDYRSEVSRCRGMRDTYPLCLEAALDQATVALNQLYVYQGDPLSLDGNELKNAAHQQASLLKDDARKAPAQCLKEEAEKLDDNVSPASDVALGVAQSCKPKAVEFATFASDTLILWDVLDLIPRMNLEQINDLSERSFGVQAATQVVLQARAEKSKTPNKFKPKAKKKKSKAAARKS